MELLLLADIKTTSSYHGRWRLIARALGLSTPDNVQCLPGAENPVAGDMHTLNYAAFLF